MPPRRPALWAALALAVVLLAGVAVLQRVEGDRALRTERRVTDSMRIARADAAATQLTLVRRRAERDTTLHLAVAVDSGLMYLVRNGIVLRTMAVQTGVTHGVRAVSAVGTDTVTLGDGTVLYGGPPGASSADSTSASSAVRLLPDDFQAILADLGPQTRVYFYGEPLVPQGSVPPEQPYIVVSITDHRLWYRDGGRTIYTTRVATGTGKELVQEIGAPLHWKFDTPRGRLVVLSKETDPVWVPPDWHYVEMATKKHTTTIKLARGQSIRLKGTGGARILVDGSDVVTRFPDGHEEPFEVSEGKEIVANGKIVIPPYGTNQRRYTGTLGVYRLYFGEGYGLHGTDEPASIGQSASHGCVRLRNEDIETLYRLVPTGTPVYIY